MKRFFLAVCIAIVAFVAWEWLTFPDVESLRTENPKTTAFMQQRMAALRAEGKSDTIDFRWVPYRRIAPNLRRAVLVAEDSAFYDHKGVDMDGLREALKRDLDTGKLSHGGSTITQQLAKNLYLSPSRNPYRKVKELLIARALEHHLQKKRIFEIYLNVVEFGEKTYGAEAAAQHYFQKPASALNASEAALLAGSLPNPRIMNPGKPNKRLKSRQRMILSRMRRWGYYLEREVLTQKKPVSQTSPAPAQTVPVEDPDLTPPDVPESEPPSETSTASEGVEPSVPVDQGDPPTSSAP